MGLEAAERQASAAERQAEQELAGRAYLAGVDPQDLAAAEAAVVADLDGRGQADGVDHPHGPTTPPTSTVRDLQDFVDANAPGVPGYAFVAADSNL